MHQILMINTAIENGHTRLDQLRTALKEHGVDSSVARRPCQVVDGVIGTIKHEAIVIEVTSYLLSKNLHETLVQWGWDRGLIFYSALPQRILNDLVAATGGCYVSSIDGARGLAERIDDCASGHCPGNNCHWRTIH